MSDRSDARRTRDGPGRGRGAPERIRAAVARAARRALRRGPGPVLFTVLCVGLAVAFFAEFVFAPGRMLFGTDMVDQAYQLRRFAVQEIRSGRGIPLWNPFVYAGVPYVGILPGPLFYPTSVLYLVLPLFRAIGWTFVLHTAGAGVLGWGAARAFGLRRWSAAAAGLAFMFAGYVVSTLYGGHDGRMFAMVLVPAVFACAERGLETGDLRWFAGMGVAVALQVFTPHVQVMYFSSLAVSLYAAWRLALAWREAGEGDGTEIGRRAAGFAGGFALAALLGAVQILPAADLLRHGVRGGGAGGYEFASSWALPPQELTALFLPDLIGSLRDLYWGSNPFKLHTEYLGAGTLALASVGVLNARSDRRVWFLAGASLAGLAFALGGATPVHRIAYEIVPLVDSFRAPAMMLGPVSFFVALLAGFGVERILEARASADGDAGPTAEGEGGRAPVGWGRVLVASAPFLLLSIWAALDPEGLTRFVRNGWYRPGWPREASPELHGMLRTTGLVVAVVWGAVLAAGWAVSRRRLPRWALAGVLVLLVADLWRVDARYLETVDPDRVFGGGAAVERMQEALAPGERVWQIEDTFGANELMYWRIPSVTGSQNFRLEWYDRLVGGVGLQELARSPVLWPLLDLRFVAARSPLETPLLQEELRDGALRLYEVAPDLPHAFFPEDVRAVEGLDAALESARGLTDPGGLAVVEPATGDGRTPAAGRGRASLERWDPDEVVLDVRAEEAGALVLSEVWHPGWRAQVDGEEVPVYRANGAFRAVPVPAGQHRLRLEYVSTPFRAGAGLSLAAAAGTLVVLAAATRRRRRGR